MTYAWFHPFIIIGGVLQAAGAVMNAQLRTYLANPWLAPSMASSSQPIS